MALKTLRLTLKISADGLMDMHIILAQVW